MEFIDLKAQYKKLDSKINNNIKKVLNDSHFIMGEEVKILEKECMITFRPFHFLTLINFQQQVL